MLRYHITRSRNITEKFLINHKKDPQRAMEKLKKTLSKERNKIKNMVENQIKTKGIII